METRKIGIACFTGGSIGALVSLFCSPAFWWLGLIAGFAAGYLAYEFRAVLRAIPHACALVYEGASQMGHEVSNDLKDARVFIWSWGLNAFTLFAMLSLWTEFRHGEALLEPFPGFNLSPRCAQFEVNGFLSVFGAFLMLGVFAEIGNAKRKEFWKRKIITIDREALERRTHLLLQGYAEVEPTVRLIFLRGFLGVGFAIFYAMYVIGWSVCLTPRFLYVLIVQIHSYKRVLCGFDSALGGAMGYLLLARHTHTITEAVLVSICGGLIGGALGILNWEVVSVRILKVAKAK